LKYKDLTILILETLADPGRPKTRAQSHEKLKNTTCSKMGSEQKKLPCITSFKRNRKPATVTRWNLNKITLLVRCCRIFQNMPKTKLESLKAILRA
jgi:hypothetical protein